MSSLLDGTGGDADWWPRCRACGRAVDPLGSDWVCSHRSADQGADHVLALRSELGGGVDQIDRSSELAFVRYRSRLLVYRAALAAGWSDARYCELVESLDTRVREVAGVGYVRTPLVEAVDLGATLGLSASAGGRLWAKDETGNVSGSHKGRHLFGLVLWLAVRGDTTSRLGIASCGNAALAAATLASATGRDVEVFVPTWADPGVVGRLQALGAQVVRCARRDDEQGDPCVLRVREAVAAGTVPFGCQGPDNGFTIDGGRTIGWEIAEQLADLGVVADAVAVQVGGGALGASLGMGLREGGCGARLIAVQAEGCAPFARAMRRVRSVGLAAAVAERAATMWPWEGEPASSATGILDDETYDWACLAEQLSRSGGDAPVASEAQVIEAHRLVHEHTGIDADPTGTASVAALLAVPPDPADRLVVTLTGATRGG